VFSPTATQSLGYVASMLEAGIPVVYLYIADAHDNRGGPGTFGPGEAGYVAQLKAYDKAWGQFFARLAADRIDQSNTLFIVTADEGDHFVGGAPSPANCDGVHVPCTYFYADGVTRSVGELTTNLDSVLSTQRGNNTQFLVHADDAPTIYVQGNPLPTAPVTRTLEQDLGQLIWVNPLPGKIGEVDQLAPFLADQAEMRFLHMVTSSPARTPTVTMFGNPDYFFQTTSSRLPINPTNCTTSPATCVFQNNLFAWNHGDVQSDIVTTFLGIVGPGVRNTGIESAIWSDHTDVRPTMLALLGLKDDYVHDGRALVEVFQPQALNSTLRHNFGAYVQLATAYKQLNAPLGALARGTLGVATRAATSSTPGDSAYNAWLALIGGVTTQRDTLAAQMKAALDGATFGGGFDAAAAAPVAEGAGRFTESARLMMLSRQGNQH